MLESVSMHVFESHVFSLLCESAILQQLTQYHNTTLSLAVVCCPGIGKRSGAMADDAAAKAAAEASAKKRRSYKLVVDPDLKVSVPLLCPQGPSVLSHLHT